MTRPSRLLFVAFGVASALHEHLNNTGLTGPCVAPGTCTPPATKYSQVVKGPRPGQQWNWNGGFCGAWSVQQSALAFGAWISQDLVRKANKDGPGPHTMHGDTHVGYEVMPVNVAYTAQKLKLDFDEFNYNQPKPQAAAYKKWLKSHLSKGHPVVWFPLCKGDDHACYGGQACPNGGHVDHVEPIFGIFSDKPLTDEEVYDDDWIVHASDQDLQPYYRKFSTLQDSVAMDGNCADAGAGFGKNEMYPCFDEQVTYGLAIKGLAVKGTLPVTLTVPINQEPNVRLFQQPIQIKGTVQVSGLEVGKPYTLYRFGSTEALPSEAPFTGFQSQKNFVASGSTWTYQDPDTFSSDSATYYIAVEAASPDVVV